jgi:hypothetical protein
LGAVALVFLGLFVLFRMLEMAQGALMFYSIAPSSSPSVLLVLVWLPVAVAAAGGMWLIRKRQALATRWFDDTSPAVAFKPTSVLHLAFIIVGVVFVALAVSGLLSAVLGAIVWFGDEDMAPGWRGGLIDATYPLGFLVVGILLIGLSGHVSRRLWPPTASAQQDAAGTDCPTCGAVALAEICRDDVSE